MNRLDEVINNKKMVLAILTIVLIAIIVGTSIAYFTEKTDIIQNTVTVGKVDIRVDEPNWDPEEGKSIEPGEELKKDPKIKNTGRNAAYVYMEVKVPKSEVIIVDGNESLTKKELTDIFEYQVNDGWELIETLTATNNDNNYSTYVYAYVNGPINANSSTSSLFDKIKYKNVLEGQLDPEQEYSVLIKGYAVQSDTIKIEGNTTRDKVLYAYENYIKGAN